MKNTHCCSKCNGRRVLHVRHVRDKSPGLASQPLSIATEQSFWGFESKGLLEAFVCEACGYTEWYTSDPESLVVDGENIRLLEGPPRDEGPFR